jgi:hypothetical protein
VLWSRFLASLTLASLATSFGCCILGTAWITKLLASYTGVLIGATAIPVWSQNRKILPAHFPTSGLGDASGVLEVFGFLIPATQILGFVASAIETLLDIFLEVRKRPVDAPSIKASRDGRFEPRAFWKDRRLSCCVDSGAGLPGEDTPQFVSFLELFSAAMPGSGGTCFSAKS